MRTEFPQTELTQEAIQGEIDAYRQQYTEEHGTEDGWRFGLLNNFNMHLPMPEDLGGQLTSYRRIFQRISMWDTPQKEITKGETDIKYSQLRLMQTPHEFYATIDHSLEETGMSLKEVERLQREETKETLYERVMPAYIKLRLIGYDLNDFRS